MGVALTFDDKHLAAYLHDGGLAVIPTDTLYGLVCRAADPAAVRKLYNLKKREAKPGTLIAASIDHLVDLGFKRRYLTAVEKYWPGAVSIVIPTGPELGYIHLGKYGIACRIPKDPTLHKLLAKTGPLLTTSANHPGEQPATSIKQAVKIFGEAVDAYVDGGDLSDRKPSTVIRMIDDAVEILREGAVTIDETGKVIDK